jgi:hypothetical protein
MKYALSGKTNSKRENLVTVFKKILIRVINTNTIFRKIK